MSQREMDLTRESLDQSASGDRRIVIVQMITAAGLILSGGIMGLVAMGYSAADANIALALGTAVIGAGAAMLPTGAAAGASARILHLPEPYAASPPATPAQAPAAPREAPEPPDGEEAPPAPLVVGVTAPVRSAEVRQYVDEHAEPGADGAFTPPVAVADDDEDEADLDAEAPAPAPGGAVRGGVEDDL